jgi:hypothetical protein
MQNNGSITDSEPTAEGTGYRWKWLLYLAVVVALIIAVRYLPLQELLKQALGWVAELGTWARSSSSQSM